MKHMLLTMAVLTLLVGISGCLYPRQARWGEWRQHRYERGGQGNTSGRDCFRRDGHRYCRDGH